MSIPIPETQASPRFLPRMMGASFGQVRRTPVCPDAPRLDGQLAVVTGATGGIGFEIARGLAVRGATLIVPCRNLEKGRAVAERLDAGAGVELVEADLEDLASVRAGAAAVAARAAGRPVDLLVENAGLWPLGHGQTAQGHEIAFGVNVLAHFVLRGALAEAGLLRATRVVVLTGDIYILTSECTPDYAGRGPLGGMLAYCRSKLGNLWIAGELARRHPELDVRTVHPGVVASNLGGELGAVGGWFRRQLMISTEAGAQMPLVCATQPGLESGGYWHNVYGRMRLAPQDPASDRPAAARLWDVCSELSKA